ncbi:leucine Rich Repeat family protein [Aphelenchoides avenae]|nr:leucine Rich Repeat family protein [Aphelenchus avenae]KAH7721987.1 leucine Rich Repeat family protein [Aphelenchus avenae]
MAQTTMEERLKLELHDRKPAEVEDLILDNCKGATISGLSEEFTNLQTLSLINIGLTSLDGLPKLPALRTIDLSDNKITGGLEKLIESCPRLYHLNLCANKIKDVDTLVPLKKLSELNAIDLFDCDVTKVENYREKVFEALPQIKYLDGFDINDVEAEISDGEGEDGLGGEGDGLSDEESEGETGDEENGVGLDYLNSSEALKDEDESEDFAPEENGDGKGKARGTKRKANGEDKEAPPAKST